MVRPNKTNWRKKAAALAAARPAVLEPAFFTPQLAVLASTAPSGPGWIHELKFDGYRLVCVISAGKAYLWSRNGISWSHKLRNIVKALEQLDVDSAAFDCELIAGQGRRVDFGDVPHAVAEGKASLVLFDLLHLDGISIEAAPLIHRRSLLQQLLSKSQNRCLAFSSHVEDGAQAFSLAAQLGFEGIVSKRADRPYVHGRSDDWRKSKAVQTEELAVVGYTPSSVTASFASLLVARRSPMGWVYAGRVGTGFSDQLAKQLMRLLIDASPTPTVALPSGEDRPWLRHALWFEPRFVIEVAVRGRTKGRGVLRQPSFKAMRLDKSPSEL